MVRQMNYFFAFIALAIMAVACSSHDVDIEVSTVAELPEASIEKSAAPVPSLTNYRVVV